MKNLLLTIDFILANDACYSREELEALFGDRKEVLLSEALRDERVKPIDRGWLCDVFIEENPLYEELHEVEPFFYGNGARCLCCTDKPRFLQLLVDRLEGKDA